MVRGSDKAIRYMYAMKDPKSKEAKKVMNEIGSEFTNTGGDVAKTADYIGISRATLHRWINRHAYLSTSLKAARVQGPRKPKR